MDIKRDKDQPLYMISIAAEMLGVHPQTLRLYEREGLICPKRQKRQRIYSDEDIEKLSLIIELTRELGVNKAGVEIVLRLRNRLESLQGTIEEMMSHLEEEMRRDFEERIRSIFRE